MWLGQVDTVAELPGIDRLSGNDLAALKIAADELKIPVDFLATIMSLESGFDPSAVNSISNATGLIQFMPSTAKALGTNVLALREMSFQEQLPFVIKFYKGNRCTGVDDVGTLYMCTFCPAAKNLPDDEILARRYLINDGPCGIEADVYEQNRGLDLNDDGVLTVGDVRNKARNWLNSVTGQVPIPEFVPEVSAKSLKSLALGAGMVAAFGVGFFGGKWL